MSGAAADDAARPAPLRRRVRARAIRAAAGAFGRLPAGALERAARPIARAALARHFGDTVAANVEAALPWLERNAPEAAARVREARFARALGDFGALQLSHWLKLSRGAAPGERRGAWVDALVDLDPSIEHLDAALAEGRGAIVVTGHIGDWELLCARLARRGTTGAVVGRVRRGDPSHSWLVTMRRAYGVETLPQDGAPRAMLRVLRGGGVLGLLTDLRARRVDSTKLPLLGVEVETMTAAASFARASGAPVVPMRCVRAPSGRFVLHAEPPLSLREDVAREDAAVELLRAQNATFERWIAETPEQWAWHQERLAVAR